MLKKWIFLLGLTLLLARCGQSDDLGKDTRHIDSSDKTILDRVIYGDDDRKDLYQVTDPRLLKLADSTVALIDQNSLRASVNGIVEINGKNFGTSQSLCQTEPYREQNTASFCSGALVGKNKIITAGHCIETAADCANVRFAFGFAVKAAGVLPQSLPASEIYLCKSIIKTVKENKGADYAVIELDRDVVGHEPLKVSQRGVLKTQDALLVIGHPSGLPTKVADGGSVRSVATTHYVTNLDTYGGNSGSAVFNSNTGEIEGILVRGENDYVYKNGCYVSYRCASGACRGEDVTRIDLVLPYLDTAPPPVVPPAKVEFSNSVRVSVPDANTVGIRSNINVNQTPNGRKVKVSVNITHPYIGDLVVTLVDPNGKSYVLQSRKGGSADNIVGVYGELLASQSSLIDLSQVKATGVWSLKVADLARIDVGALNSWKLIFE